MIIVQCLVLRRYGVEDANWSHPIFPPVTTATILAARNFFHHHDPGGLPRVRAKRWCCEKLLGAHKPYMVNVPEEGTGGGGLNDDDEILDPPRLVLLIYEASSLLPKRLSLVFDSLE